MGMHAAYMDHNSIMWMEQNPCKFIGWCGSGMSRFSIHVGVFMSMFRESNHMVYHNSFLDNQDTLFTMVNDKIKG